MKAWIFKVSYKSCVTGREKFDDGHFQTIDEAKEAADELIEAGNHKVRIVCEMKDHYNLISTTPEGEESSFYIKGLADAFDTGVRLIKSGHKDVWIDYNGNLDTDHDVRDLEDVNNNLKEFEKNGKHKKLEAKNE